jgi:hypothetical protein
MRDHVTVGVPRRAAALVKPDASEDERDPSGNLRIEAGPG